MIENIYNAYLQQILLFTTKHDCKIKYIQHLKNSHLHATHQFLIKPINPEIYFHFEHSFSEAIIGIGPKSITINNVERVYFYIIS